MTQFAPLSGSIVGMDTEAIRQIALRCEEASEQVNVALGEIAKQAATTQWTGPDAKAFAANWASDVNSQTQQVIAALNQAAQNLRIQAAQQEEASGSGGGGTSGSGGGSQGDGFAGGGGGGGGGGGWGPKAEQSPTNPLESLLRGADALFKSTADLRTILGAHPMLGGALDVAHHMYDRLQIDKLGIPGHFNKLLDFANANVPGVSTAQNFLNDAFETAGKYAGTALKGLDIGLSSMAVAERVTDFALAQNDAERWSAAVGYVSEGLKSLKPAFPAAGWAGAGVAAVSDIILHASQSDFSPEGFKQVGNEIARDGFGCLGEVFKAGFKAIGYF